MHISNSPIRQHCLIAKQTKVHQLILTLEEVPALQKVSKKISILCILGKEISLMSTLTPSPELENCHMVMKFLAQHHLHVHNTCVKFQGQEIYTKKAFEIYQIRNCEKGFTIANFDIHPRIETKFGHEKFAWTCG